MKTEIEILNVRLSKIEKKVAMVKTDKERRLLLAKGFTMIGKSIRRTLNKHLN